MARQTTADTEAARWAQARLQLMEEVDADFANTSRYTGKAQLEPRTRAAMADVPRHLFVPATEQPLAYIDHALSIGCGQTISQPFIVALMTSLLEPRSDHIVLEVGTGSGYQAAVLSSLVAQLYSIEVIEQLADAAAARLRRLGYANVAVRCGDGACGWPEHAPFDGIIVTAAAQDVPPALVEQLKPGARLVMPVGGHYGQDLRVYEKQADGSVEFRSILPVAFVPLTDGGGDGQ